MNIANNRFEYQERLEDSLKALYNRKKPNGFSNFESFQKWYEQQPKQCYYCGLPEEVSQKVVLSGRLKSKRFPEDGFITQGRARGVYLEIDRKDPEGEYSEDNCVLCCYFCNNDKSDVFNAEEYKKFMLSRAEYLKQLLNQ